MNKKILVINLLFFLIIVTGCNKESIVKNDSNCKIFDCINQIEPENTVDQINEIIGFKGDLIDKKYKIYNWSLSDKESIQIAYYSSDKSQIKIKYNRKDLADKKVNFSKHEQIKENLKKGVKITYDDLKKYFKTNGTMVAKSSMSKKYAWVSENGSYLIATINTNNNRCTLLTGKVK